ncbi:hypothetical protein BGZ73_003027 [Actinomortierella ambigua]|nr:hypothetical protein BGZ73_003027 [Actinomortierella ambigua]
MDREDDAWSRHQQYIASYVKYFQKDKAKETGSTSKCDKYSKKELAILHENHRFLRSDDDNTEELSWEQRLAKKYYDRLYKEYALVELKYYEIGRIAMRWRNEIEVMRGKGQFTCGSLRCDEARGLHSWEVNFAYVEEGVKKNALVKVRLCEACSIKLNYKKMHKQASQPTRSTTDKSTSRGSSRHSSRNQDRQSSSPKDRHHGRGRSRSRDRERSTRKDQSRSESVDRGRAPERRDDREVDRSKHAEADRRSRRGSGSRSPSPSARRGDNGRSTSKGSSPDSGDFETFFQGLFD